MIRRKGIGKYLPVLVIGATLLGSGLLLSQPAPAQDADAGAKGKSQTLEGIVSDSVCGAKHTMADAAKCTHECARHGFYALVVGDKVYKLNGKTNGIEKLEGAKAKVSGTVDNARMSIRVRSVAVGS